MEHLIKLLQFGAAGVFVALPFLAYKVIIAMITVDKLDPAVVRSFYWFLGFEALLAAMFVVLRMMERRAGSENDVSKATSAGNNS